MVVLSASLVSLVVVKWMPEVEVVEERKPKVEYGVEQEVLQVVGEREQEDHVEVLQHEVEDNEVAVVSSVACEVRVLAKYQGEVEVRRLLGRPCQNHWGEDERSAMSSEARSSERMSKKVGETKVSIPFQ